MRPRIALLLLVLGGCISFDAPSLVKDLRVLAVEVDPPELTPATSLSSLTARALVVSPGAVESVDWSIAMCLVAATGASFGDGLFGEDQSAALGRCPSGSAVLARGTTSLEAIGYVGAIPPEALGALAGSAQGTPQRLQLELTLGAPTLYAEKSVRVSPVLPPGQEPNLNPVLSGLTFDGQPWLAGTPISLRPGSCIADKLETVTNTDRTTSTLCTHDLVPMFDDAERQHFVALSTVTGEPVAQLEGLRLAWFADQGVFHDDTTQQGSEDPHMRARDLSNVWRETAGLLGDVTFWIVVRDGRGGASWETRVLHFEG